MDKLFTTLNKKFQDELAQVDAVVHILLKGHLILEETLVAILEQHLFHPEHLPERLSFADKMALCRALCLRKDHLGEWDLLGAINSLRNEIAHKLNSVKRTKKLKTVKDLYFREAAKYPQIEAVKAQDDSVIVMYACAHCGGFLSSFLGDAKAFRALVHGLDREMNPDLPEFKL